MFEELVKIHDKFSVEIKLGFIPLRKQKVSNFAVNTWIFIPKSLDITKSTYQKSDFYRDLKSNIRLITPVYNLREIASSERSPIVYLTKSFQSLSENPTRSRIADYEYNIRMFLSILKSSLRNELNSIEKNFLIHDKVVMVEKYVTQVCQIAQKYRDLRSTINVSSVKKEIVNYYFFGDEFMSNSIEHNTFKLLKKIKELNDESNNKLLEKLATLIHEEIEYKKANGYPIVEEASPDHNRRLLSRLGVLKKFAESELYLNVVKRRDGVLIEQIYLSIAAGLSMVFATAIAFSFQQKFGNLTMPFFVALVVSYMLKDRIKELARHYFAHKLGNRYFDQKTNITLKNHVIGSEREAMDHITFDKIPKEVIALRSRSSVFEEYARQHADSVLLYRKVINLNRENLDKISSYAMPGINEIIRINVSNFLQKMDNAKIPLFALDGNNGYQIIKGEKVYYLNIVMQMKRQNKSIYYHYRIVMNRSGILDIEKIS